MYNLKDKLIYRIKDLLQLKTNIDVKNCMHSRNPAYPLPQGAFSVHINGDHNHVSRYKSYSFRNWVE